MISHGKDIKVFCGNANQPLAAEICQMMGTKLGESEVKSFADGEVSVSINESVRGCDVFVVQSTCKPVNNNLMELLIMIDAEDLQGLSHHRAVCCFGDPERRHQLCRSRAL